jgi:FkbM family methyltransferase
LHTIEQTTNDLFERQKVLDAAMRRLDEDDRELQDLSERQRILEAAAGRLDENERALRDLLERQKVLEAAVMRLDENEQTQEIANAHIRDLQIDIDKIKSIGLDIFSDSEKIGEEFFSQCGEDMIASFILSNLRIPPDKASYLDIGANHAKFLSNTYYFYLKGARGVLVEANPTLIQELKFYRHGDVILNRCVSDHSGEMTDFYIFDIGDGLSTTDKYRADQCLAENSDLKAGGVIQVESIAVGDIFDAFFETPPTILSIDIEGAELTILRAIDFKKYRPLIIIIEVIPYKASPINLEKDPGIMSFMKENGYVEQAFSGVNSIFLDASAIGGGK